jgi:hypothetical protein
MEKELIARLSKAYKGCTWCTNIDKLVSLEHSYLCPFDIKSNISMILLNGKLDSIKVERLRLPIFNIIQKYYPKTIDINLNVKKSLREVLGVNIELIQNNVYIPKELILIILQKCGGREIDSMKSVNKYYCSLINDDIFWQGVFMKRYSYLQIDIRKLSEYMKSKNFTYERLCRYMSRFFNIRCDMKYKYVGYFDNYYNSIHIDIRIKFKLYSSGHIDDIYFMFSSGMPLTRDQLELFHQLLKSYGLRRLDSVNLICLLAKYPDPIAMNIIKSVANKDIKKLIN